MKVIENQTLYQCEHCNKRFVSRNGVIRHEKFFCRVVIGKRELEANCKHENVLTHWEVMQGESFAKEPSYEYCEDCGKKKHPFKGWDYE